MEDTVRYMERAYVIALDAGRKDLQTIAAQALAQTHIIRLELDEAELLLTRALELAGESGSVRARVGATLSYGWFLTLKGELAAAETLFEEVRASSAELGVEPAVAAALAKLGWIARLRETSSAPRSSSGRRCASSRLEATTACFPTCRLPWPRRSPISARSTKPSGSRSRLGRTRAFATRALTVAAATALRGGPRGAGARATKRRSSLDSALALARDGDFKVFELEPLARLVDLRARVGRNGAETPTKRAWPSSRRRPRAPLGSPDSTARPATRR